MNPITLPIAELKPALAGLGKVINLKSNPSIAQFVKIERTAEGWVALTTTDLDSFITVRLEQPSTGAPLITLVPFEQLSSLIKSCGKEEQVHITPNANNTVTIKFHLASSLGESVVKAPPVTEYPPTPKISSDPVSLPPALRQSIHEAMACTSEDPTRRVLHGAFIDTQERKNHYVVATDGKHLYSSNSFHLPLKNSVLIPKHKFLGWREFNNDGEWALKFSDQWIQLNSRRWRFITRQIEGIYPKWRAVLPDSGQTKTVLTIDPQTLEAVIQTIEKLPSHNDQYHTIGLEWKDKRLNLLAKAETGDPWTGVPVKLAKAEGRDITIFLDRRLLEKALQFRLNTISLIDEISPLRFTNDGRQMIVMPLRFPVVESKPKPHSALPRKERVPPPPTQPMQPTPPPSPPPDQPLTMDAVIDAVVHVRESFISGLNKLRDLGAQLKHLQREQKSSSRELNSVRSTLRSLQGLKL